jgi:hypothetical protein
MSQIGLVLGLDARKCYVIIIIIIIVVVVVVVVVVMLVDTA